MASDRKENLEQTSIPNVRLRASSHHQKLDKMMKRLSHTVSWDLKKRLPLTVIRDAFKDHPHLCYGASVTVVEIGKTKIRSLYELRAELTTLK